MCVEPCWRLLESADGPSTPRAMAKATRRLPPDRPGLRRSGARGAGRGNAGHRINRVSGLPTAWTAPQLPTIPPTPSAEGRSKCRRRWRQACLARHRPGPESCLLAPVRPSSGRCGHPTAVAATAHLVSDGARAKRKPRVLPTSVRDSPSRQAERQNTSGLTQLPPRWGCMEVE